jgi:hypothetical protein
MDTDHRKSAEELTGQLIRLLEAHPRTAAIDALLAECESLARAIAAFHMEGIRFRMFNVDRLIARNAANVPGDAGSLVGEIRRELEAAGFHTRSHQAPTS